MSGNGISISGLGSGLDTNSIIAQLLSLERLPLEQIESKKKTEQAKLSALGTLKGYVKDLQKQAQELGKRSGFLSFKVEASEEGVASFSASGAAQAGTHSLTVLQLATIDRWTFDGVASQTDDLATGEGEEISFDVDGTNYSITLQQASSSLEDIASEINELAGEDVTASVVNTGTESAPSYKLVLTAVESGEEGRISNIVSTVGGLTIDGTLPDGSGVPQSTNNITVGNNALAEIDGLLVERTTNEFNDVLAGISINVQSADPDNTIQFSVEADTEAVSANVKKFVDTYNKVIGFLNEHSTYDKENGPGGELFGDSVLRGVRQSIRSALFNVDIGTVMDDAEGFSTLGLVGIETQSDGTLLIDKTVFEEKMADNLDALADLFIDSDGFDNGGALENTPEFFEDTTTDSGLAASLERAISRMLGSFTGPEGTTLKGLFESRTDTFNSNMKRFDKQIEDKEFYLDQYEKNLVKRFASLEQIIGGLNAQGAALQSSLLSAM
jgi:flagellar hook-associated protein 2